MCRQLRQGNNQTPILVVSARDSETDRVLGLEVGADDYLVKPFGMRELVARCRALLRRTTSQQAPVKVLEHANICLYQEECRVTRNGLDVNLSPKEYRLLELFMQNPAGCGAATSCSSMCGASITSGTARPWMCTSVGCARSWRRIPPARCIC